MATGDPDEIEEERRLFYVALTRARDWLYVCVPLRYYTTGRRLHDRHGYAQPSRFLAGKAGARFQPMQAVEGGLEPGGPVEAAAQTAESIRADIRSLWDVAWVTLSPARPTDQVAVLSYCGSCVYDPMEGRLTGPTTR